MGLTEQDSKLELNASHDVLNVQQLRLVLENIGVALSHEDLIHIFRQISGDDRNEFLTMTQLVKFANTEQKPLKGRANHRAVLLLCLKSPGFWADFMYSVGSAGFLLDGWLEDTNGLASIGFVGYFAGSLGGMINHFKSVRRSLCSTERADARLLATAVKLGMLLAVTDETFIIRKSAILGVKESHISWLSETELRKLQKVGARKLFKLADLSDDQILDELQLYRALIKLGKNMLRHISMDPGAQFPFFSFECFRTTGVYISIANSKQLYARLAIHGQVHVVS
jgi:hypothetical protein